MRNAQQRLSVLGGRKLAQILGAIHSQLGLSAPPGTLTKEEIVERLLHHVSTGILSIESIEAQAGAAPVASIAPSGAVPSGGIDPGALSAAIKRSDALVQDMARQGLEVNSLQQKLEQTTQLTPVLIDAAIGPVKTQVTLLETELSKLADKAAQIEKGVRGITESIRIPEDVVRREISAAVASAFKPLEAAVRQAGPAAEAAVVETVETLPERKTAKQIFGVSVTDIKGRELEFDVYSDPEAETPDPLFIWTKGIIKQLYTAQTGGNLWFGGEKGTGKSDTARQFAARTGRKFVRINFRQYTTAEDYLGAGGLEGGNTVFQPGAFLSAYIRPGCVILLDEVTNTSPGELAPLNGFLEGKARVNYGNRVWVRGMGVCCFAADNTTGNGDVTGRYSGTRQQNTALLDRFSGIINFQFLDPSVEVKAITNHTGCSPDLAKKLVKILNICRHKVASGDIVDAPSLRAAIYFVQKLPILGAEEAWNCTIAARQPAESAVALEAIKTAEFNAADFESLI